MDIVPIFDSPNPKMASVHYDGDDEDIFAQLLSKWYDRSYLTGFFTAHIDELNAYWKLSVADAVEYVIEEVTHFEEELLAIQNEEPGYEDFDMKTLFKKYHEKEFSIRKKGENFRKARPDLNEAMLRLYAIELEDGYVITGGCIKLTHQLTDEIKNIVEPQLKMAQDYINVNKIVSLTDLQ